jgi:predicted ATPase
LPAGGVPLFVAWGTLLRGWALAEQGQGAEGVAQVRQGLAAWRAEGAELWQPYFLALLAEALTVMHHRGERWWEAELYRRKGELLLHQSLDQHTEAHACFQHALAVARDQQARSLELRAATSLARLWQQQGQCAEAQQLLAEVYCWFTEGFDTADLQEAKTLLEVLT